MDLIAKTVNLSDEPIKTGAAVAFVNLERFTAGRKIEVEKCSQQNGAASSITAPTPLIALKDEVTEAKLTQTKLSSYLSSMFDMGKVVYCRYGRDYIPNIAK